MNILDSTTLASYLEEELIEKTKAFKEQIKLTSIMVGQDLGSKSYDRSLMKICDKVGFSYECLYFDKNISQEKLILEIEKLNKSESIHGILIFQPLPKHIDSEAVFRSLDKAKDVDGINEYNFLSLYKNNKYKNVPATALAIWRYLKSIVDLKGRDILIINRSMVIGLPLFHLLLNENATVTIAHSKSQNIEDQMESKDIIISAVGRSKIFVPKKLRDGAIILDVGISKNSLGKYCGDVDTAYIENERFYYMPPFKGIGNITSLEILNSTYENFRSINGK